MAATVQTDSSAGAGSEPGFRDVPYAESDEAIVPRLLATVREAVADESRVDAVARSLIEGIRGRAGGVGGLEDFLREYGLSTREGLALMVMAEALLRVPDHATQQALIEEKIGVGDWAHREDGKRDSSPLFVSAATWGLGLSTRVVRPGETPEGIVSRMVQRLGRPAVRTGVQQAMRFLGHQFVLGESIEDAMKRASGAEDKGYRHSYDMLGEGARTRQDAARYKRSYGDAIEAIGRHARKGSVLPARPGISVKLSALHPKYTARNRVAVLEELVPDVLDLARAARRHELNFTIDAEEADRLELSLDVMDAVLEAMNADATLDGWIGFGLAVQAYQKRAPAVIDHVADLARRLDARLMVRLVKGAYWDTEVKHVQVDGQHDFPVYTRKSATDLSYLACAAKMLEARPALYPQFATHNALTVATILEMAAELGPGADAFDGFEFQRLHGMGEALYAQVTEEGVRVRDRGPSSAAGPVKVAARVYAPVGGHRDLLAYLVRRLLENGANSSFVARVTDKKVPVDELLERPATLLESGVRHAGIPRSAALFDGRRNSRGFGFGERSELDALVGRMRKVDLSGLTAGPLVGGEPVDGTERRLVSPVDGTPLGTVHDASPATVDAAFASARAGFAAWNGTPVEERARALERAADLIERRRDRFLAILAREAGKTLDDGIAEVREAVDFLRYYAIEARRLFVVTRLPGPAGEENLHRMEGRGTFVTIAPWNFPLAIFLGQTGAALAAGNAVVAKPAPQTALVAHEAVRALHEAGVPGSVLQFVPGYPDVGRAVVAHPDVMGVAFTGSTATARAINRALAGKDGPIVPLIAETGGINAMIVDATALPEQVTDDVIMSAFRSAGQRCSALRVLYLQDDVHDRILSMIEGAAETLVLGDPMDPATDVGPVIDADALARLRDYVATHRDWVRWTGHWPDDGVWMAPHILEVPAGERVTSEVFGPVLHVKRWKAGTLDAVLDEIESTGYGLTFGVHTRIDAVVARCTERAPAGNLYVNRNTIGAIVGSQPFGGSGLSGTGPKAGGPHYLPRFAHEVVVSTDTTAAGGNASLIAMGDG